MTSGRSRGPDEPSPALEGARLAEAEYLVLFAAESSGIFNAPRDWHPDRTAQAVASLIARGYLATNAAGQICITQPGQAAYDAEDLVEWAVIETGVLRRP